MYNLNKGKNDELLDKCKALKDYMTLINYIRENQEAGMPVEEAVDKAVSRCIDEDVLYDILKKNRAEVMDVCITEYNEEVFINGIMEEGRAKGREEGRAEGRAEGREEGRAEGMLTQLIDLVQDGLIGIADASKRANMSEQEFELLLNK